MNSILVQQQQQQQQQQQSLHQQQQQLFQHQIIQQQQLLQQQQQQQLQQQIQQIKEPLVGATRLVQSGKVYRQLFEAQVQLSEALDKVKEKYRENPTQVKQNENGIPIIKEGRGLRGNGFLTIEGDQWLNSDTNELYKNNPIFYKYKAEEKNQKLSHVKKKAEKEDVITLPDTVVPASKGSNIESRIEISRKKKHQEAWEDMIQEIALVNLNLEPEIKRNGRNVLLKLENDDSEIELLFAELNDENTITNGSNSLFENFKQKLLKHIDKRRVWIDEMDKAFLNTENNRVENIRNIFNKYSDVLFKINYFPRPQIEKLFDAEIQQLNNQILINKTCYAQLYARLITGDIEREKNQINLIENRLVEWRSKALEIEIIHLQNFVVNLNMINPDNNETNYEEDLQQEQKSINENRIGLINALNSFKPPESTKTAVYKWYDSIKEYSKQLDEANTNFITKLNVNYEDSNQKIINKMEETLKNLIESKIIDENQSKEILEQKLLPIWSKKQRQIEEYIEVVEADFEELSQIIDKEINNLFKYLQGVTHIWDMHEIGLVKKERALQELLQDCRKDHDHDNQKREEKLDSILDQMREASSEKDLKRLMVNVQFQLEAIKRGYNSFRESQMLLVKQYPEMVKEELQKYQDGLFKYYSIQTETTNLTNQSIEEEDIFEKNKKERPKSVKSVKSKSSQQEPVDSIRFILKEVLNTDRGTKFYVTMRSSNPHNEDRKRSMSKNSLSQNNDENSSILSFDELIPNTKKELYSEVETKNHLKCSFIQLDLFKNVSNTVRMNFLNHLESWLDEANVRASSIVAAKSDEIEKEFELRIHLHEPRIKRAEMDVHNVRASELIMHEERVERHCAGIEEALENMKEQFLTMQNNLNDMGNQNKSDVLNLEIAFLNASKSIRLIALQEQLNRQRDKHMENVKVTLRNFRSKFEDKLAFLRNSNAKFRFSFNVFSDGGNFSSEEIDLHKKKLEKMATVIDTNETMMLKDMEKLEKRHLDDATRVMAQFQEKFKYHLVDLQFIEKISRWLNDTQVKIKTDVSGSNNQAKKLNDLINEFENRIDACQKPNLDKISVKPSDLLDFFEEINNSIYERSNYLKCFKDEDSVPLKYRTAEKIDENLSAQSVIPQGNLASSISSQNRSNNQSINGQLADEASNSTSSMGNQSQNSHTNKNKKDVQISSNNGSMSALLRSNSKVTNEDSALSIIKNILRNNVNETKEPEQKEPQDLVEPSQSSMNQTSKTEKRSEKQSKGSNLKISSKRAKTRDEMYAFYCTFGENRNPGNDFKSNIKNILRDSLEGILTNSEIFYREIQQQNRHVTRPQSLKETYAEFAEVMIQKLKSYYSQCEVYHNQCLKDFRECLIRFEILSSNLPELIIKEIFLHNTTQLSNQMDAIKRKNLEKISKLDKEKIVNESMLKPNLGHPNMLPKLENLNQIEIKRQSTFLKTINEFIGELKSALRKNSDTYWKDLSQSNEFLLIKFDDILTEDDVLKHEITPEKHRTCELIKRHKAGLSLEDPEKEPLIKRDKGKWNGIEKYDLTKMNQDEKTNFPTASATINTAKTSLAHHNSSEMTSIYHEKFKKIIEENLNYLKSTESELTYNSNKWVTYWLNSINQIKQLYN